MHKIFEKLQPVNPKYIAPEQVRENMGRFLEGDFPAPLKTSDIVNIDNGSIPVAIVCPGPSGRQIPEGETRTRLEILQERQQRGEVKIVLAGAAHRFLNDGTLTHVDGVVFNNPLSANETNLEHVAKTHASENETDVEATVSTVRVDVPYYVATHCVDKDEGSVFHVLQEHDADIVPFHPAVKGVEVVRDNDIAIGTGWGAAMGAVSLMAALGHHDFECYGWDGADEYSVDLPDHPDYLKEIKTDQVKICVGDKVFNVPRDFSGDQQELAGFMKAYPEAIRTIKFSGDTCNAAIFNDFDPRVPVRVIDPLHAKVDDLGFLQDLQNNPK